MVNQCCPGIKIFLMWIIELDLAKNVEEKEAQGKKSHDNRSPKCRCAGKSPTREHWAREPSKWGECPTGLLPAPAVPQGWLPQSKEECFPGTQFCQRHFTFWRHLSWEDKHSQLHLSVLPLTTYSPLVSYWPDGPGCKMLNLHLCRSDPDLYILLPLLHM